MWCIPSTMVETSVRDMGSLNVFGLNTIMFFVCALLTPSLPFGHPLFLWLTASWFHTDVTVVRSTSSKIRITNKMISMTTTTSVLLKTTWLTGQACPIVRFCSMGYQRDPSRTAGLSVLQAE